MKPLFFVIMLMLSATLSAITFTDINAGLIGVIDASVAWGDYDNDGDLDILLTGSSSGGRISLIYRNDAGIFTDINAGLSNVSSSSVAWGDYDNDGDLDIVLTGSTGSTAISKIYNNNGNSTFTDISAGLTGVMNASVAWGDYDNDGDLDILLTGYTGNTAISKIYNNNGNCTFTDINAGLTGVMNASVAWGDFDNDGDLDILLTGGYNSKVYRNNGNGTFTDIAAGLIGVNYGSVAWGDFDNDGDLDILLAGETSTITYISKVYRNNGNSTFTDIAAGLTGVKWASVAWGDYDNDGDWDILITGLFSTYYPYCISKIYTNNGNSTFTDITAGLTGAYSGLVAWGDYDYDGDLDILMTGGTGSTNISKIYRNDGAISNTVSTAPGNLMTVNVGDYINFQWDAASDVETPTLGLTYALRIGTSPGGCEILSSMSSQSGYRQKPVNGMANSNCSWKIKTSVLSGYDTYYWSVQAIDTSFLGSPFADEQVVTNSHLTFTDISANLTGLTNSVVKWGDYDSDGDLDLLMAGNTGTSLFSGIKRNDGNGTFTEINANLIGIENGSIDWGDFDNDGDLDILIAGQSSNGPLTFIYRNDSGIFTNINASITGVSDCAAKWFDCDNDGDLDVLISGMSSSGRVSQIWCNNSDRSFSLSNASLTGVNNCSVDKGDFDNDGDVDIVIAGEGIAENSTKIYLNSGNGVFSEASSSLPGLTNGSIDCSDYDGDGDLDILLTGNTGDSRVSAVYSNNGSAFFTNANLGFVGIDYGSAAWGDVDNDGDQDVMLNGSNGSSSVSQVYKNGYSSFGLVGDISIPPISDGVFAWGDYDNDSDLDIAFTGISPGGIISGVLRNDSTIPNSQPSAPVNLRVSSADDFVVFEWDNANDMQTSLSGLTYNIRIGTSSGGSEIMSPGSLSSGKKLIPQRGMINSVCRWKIQAQALDYPLYWSVQAIDAGFSGSAFSAEQVLDAIPVTFSQINQYVPYPNLSESMTNFFDYDGDGDLDILRTGNDLPSGTYISKVFRNDGGGIYVDIMANMIGTIYSTAGWGDFDNDGDLDLFLAGRNYGSEDITRIYENQGNDVFSEHNVGIQGFIYGDSSCVDYDNDGDLDIAISGRYYSSNTGHIITRIYRNNGNFVFEEVSTALPNLHSGSITWGDYDNDGDLDVFISGLDVSYNSVTKIIRNDGNSYFVDINADLPQLSEDWGEWGDYDNDGDMDLLLGRSGIYRNDGNGIFTHTSADLPGATGAVWGDYDNDGDLDILNSLYGVYRNNGDDTFTNSSPRHGTSWRDYNGDGRLDILNGGQVFINHGAPINSNPSPPTALHSVIAGDFLLFQWDPSSDAETPSLGLTYELRIGTTPGGCEISAPMSYSSGYRYIPIRGNINSTCSWRIKTSSLPVPFYWSVQAIDGAFAGSAFAPEQTVTSTTPTFTEITTGLVGVYNSSLAWGDYDNDGDRDLLIAGRNNSMYISRVYRNEGNSNFVDIAAGLPGIFSGAVAWGDYDNDGDLDILLTGYDINSVKITCIYRNDGNNTFTDINAGLQGVSNSSCAWGDFDNDGDLDILLSGADNADLAITKIFRNDGISGFVDINAGLPGVSSCSVVWGDYDNDGDLDILITGSGTGSTYIAAIYRNNGNGTFSDINAGLIGVGSSSAAWCDYDNDGYLDVLYTASSSASGSKTLLYRNIGNGTFTNTNTTLPRGYFPSIACGDYDNDGDMDLLFQGYLSPGGQVTKILRQDPDHSFTDINAGLSGAVHCSFIWGDYDNDGDLDILLTGDTGSVIVTKLYRNNGSPSNSMPFTPTNLRVIREGDYAIFRWNAATDPATPALGLSYNLRIGTSPGGNEILSAMAMGNGYRLIPAKGMVQSNCYWKIKASALTYPLYWSVQAINPAYIGSAFASEVIMLSTPPYFTDSNTTLPGVYYGSSEWGDYDNDGLMDVYLSGAGSSNVCAKIFHNNGNNNFTDINAGLPGIGEDFAAWGDYDNDGDLDILLIGTVYIPTYLGYVSRIYRNNGDNTFTDINAGLPGVNEGSCAWGDYDNDGDLDILLTGSTGSDFITRIFKNNGNGTFSELASSITGFMYSSCAWGDYDNDSDLDFAIRGYQGNAYSSRIYTNNGNDTFSVLYSSTLFAQITRGIITWGDYDADGDLDVLLSGGIGSSNLVTKIYRNNGAGSFTDINASIPGMFEGETVWGDYDNDGDLDILITGSGFTKVFNNTNGVFNDIQTSFVGAEYSNASWADTDNDGDLDLHVTGLSGGNAVSKIYLNQGSQNNRPLAPTNLFTTINGNYTLFQWSPSSDQETATSGLSYNLRIGTMPGGNQISAAMSGLNGIRMIPARGFINGLCSWKIKTSALPSHYYWSVQAIDSGFLGSPFAIEQEHIGIPKAPQNFTISRVGGQVNLGWDMVTQDMDNNPITPTYYNIYINEIDDPEGEYVYLGQATQNSFTINPDLIDSDRAFFKVFAVVTYRNAFETNQHSKTRQRK